ncbi:hypothetical protein AX15_003997 [Amanita polypyramis BW_CC]|nr:hypothetical protein AX15_003997 [Amanita polypyramis BW_CC]
MEGQTIATPDVHTHPLTTVMPTTTSMTQYSPFTSPSLSQPHIPYDTSPSILARGPAAPKSLVYPSTTFSYVCVGQQLDISTDGLIAVAVLSCTVGLTLWFLFAILRPRLRSIYALREWFVHQTLRPEPLPSSLLAFLHPRIPLFPSFPPDLSGAGRTSAKDAQLFLSDEQLLQRFLWLAFIITTSWSIIGLGGGLPIYLVNIPCYLASSTGFYGGATSILLELSILRLLRVFDSGQASEEALVTLVRDWGHARVRVILTTILALAGGLLPAVYLVLKEFSKLVGYRRQWIDVKCQGKEVGWLSASQAPGFVGWGEKRMKQFIISSGLTSSLDTTENTNRIRTTRRRGGRRRQPQEFTLNGVEEASLEVDIQMLFSIGDTQHLAVLINERDLILENLETAESKYISSFRTTTPDPSVLDFELTVPPPNPNRPYISPPQPLGAHKRRPQGRRAVNRALASSSLAPTSFVAPSQYYQLRNIHALAGHPTDTKTNERGRATLLQRIPEPSFSDAFNSRIVGSRFFEVNRNSVINGHIPIGSPLSVDETGQLGPSVIRDDYSDSIPDPRLYGPNFVPETGSWDDRVAQKLGLQRGESYAAVSSETDESRDNGWVDIARTAPVEFGMNYYKLPENDQPMAGPSSHVSTALLATAPRPRPPKPVPPIPQPESHRETFPLRQKQGSESVPPPHMRIQPSQPFVRPLDGVNFNELGDVYASITHWRTQLKAINAKIEEFQRDCYNDIADGARIKGWLMVGRGLGYVPGIELIEGRAKEDIRWDVLQHEPFPLDAAVLWALIGVVVVLLAAALTAASGLSLATAPDVAHFLPFLNPLLKSNTLASGIATVLAPVIAVIVFLTTTLLVVDWGTNVYGYISISASQLFSFKFTFFSAVMATIWLVLVGALLFSLQAFSIDKTEAISMADGSISTGVLMLAIVTSFVIISPGLLLLQPKHILRVIWAQRDAVTPRQRFRGNPLVNCFIYLADVQQLFIHLLVTRRFLLVLAYLPLSLHPHSG